MEFTSGKRPVVAVIGDVMLDRYLSGKVYRISPEAPVPVLLRDEDRAVAGGAANVAANVVALGCEIRLVGLIGDDQDGSDLKQILNQGGISADSLVVDNSRPTVSKIRVVSGTQQFLRIDRETPQSPSVDVQNRIIESARAIITDADIVVLSDYAKGVFTDTVLEYIIRMAKLFGKVILVDPKRNNFQAYQGASLIKPNAGELSSATGLPCRTDKDIEAATSALASQFSGAILVTRGEAGLSLFRPNSPVLHIATSPVEISDVSGAGDTALAALAVSLAEGATLEEAAKTSNFAAGIAVSKLGTSVVNRVELDMVIARASIANHHPGLLADLTQATQLAATWHRMGESIVFTNGCFDLLHAGHIELLTSAAREGSRLIVGLNSDASVRSLKGSTRPIQTENDRARIVGALRAVDLVVLFDESTPIGLIDALSPKVLVKGTDYTEEQVVGADLVKSRGGRLVLIPIVNGCSSSKLVEKARL